MWLWFGPLPLHAISPFIRFLLVLLLLLLLLLPPPPPSSFPLLLLAHANQNAGPTSSSSRDQVPRGILAGVSPSRPNHPQAELGHDHDGAETRIAVRAERLFLVLVILVVIAVVGKTAILSVDRYVGSEGKRKEKGGGGVRQQLG